MKKFISFLKLALLSLLLIPAKTYATNEAFEHAKSNGYITCTPLSATSFRFKVLIFSRASINHWASGGGDDGSYILTSPK